MNVLVIYFFFRNILIWNLHKTLIQWFSVQINRLCRNTGKFILRKNILIRH